MLDDLEPLPEDAERLGVRPFPIRWLRVEADSPIWEDAWDLVDLAPVNDDEEAADAFYELST